MKTFEELELIGPLRRALADEKYEVPTPIQARTIPAALEGRDILGCAQTGTGKTAAFSLPILNRLGGRNRKATPNRPRALVLSPTRELAIQIGESFAAYGRHLKLRQSLVYGGVSQNGQVRVLNRGSHILVATPGRLLDLMNQGYIKLDELEMFVLDEADRMLDMGFLPDLKRIIKQLPQERQSLFFSATLPPDIVELSGRLLTDPVSVNVTPETTSLETIEQRVLFVERKGKQPLLRQILGGDDVERALVFTKTKRTANMLAERLERNGVKATAIHGNKSQNARQRALEAFRRNHVNVLVATDVAARGIDIDGITHVVNYDIPVEPESYVHRIGRTGRAGAEGIALSFCSPDERPGLRAIERLIGQRVPLAEVQPSPGASSTHSQSTHSQSSQPSSDKPRRRRRRRSATRPAAKKPTAGKPTAAAKPATAAQHSAPSGTASEGEAPKRKRRQRKGKNARSRIKQAS